MSQINPPGYPLPSGELGSDEIVCQLVYLPDRPEYWQAFYSALSYMATWRAWERDTDKRAKDAAADWRAALELTTECWRMTCLDDIETTLDAMLLIMQQPPDCCEPTDITDGDQFTDRVVDGVDDVPQNVIDAGYASGVSDWAGFDDYKCMIGYVAVDTLKARIIELAPLVDSGALIAGGVTTLVAVLAVIFTSGGVLLIPGIIVAAGAAALLYENMLNGDLLVSLAAKVVTNRNKLACAIYGGDGDVNSLIELNQAIDDNFTAIEALILKNMNMGPTLKGLYAGRYDQQDIADVLASAGYDVGDFDCECDDIGEYRIVYTFSSDLDGWTAEESGVWHSSGNPGGSGRFYSVGVGPIGLIKISGGFIAVDVGKTSEEGDYIDIHRLQFDYKCQSESDDRVHLTIQHDETETTRDGVQQSDQWEHFDETFDPPLRWIDGTDDWIISLGADATAGQWLYVDNVDIDFDSDFD